MASLCGASCLSQQDEMSVVGSLSMNILVEPTKYETSKSDNDFCHQLIIKSQSKIYANNITKRIYAYNNAHKENNSPSYTFNMLHMFMSCEIGRWIKNKIYFLIEDIPLLMNFNDPAVNSNQFIESFNDKSLFKKIVSYLDIFIYKLRIFVDVKSLPAYSNETTILRMLYLLKFKIRFFYSLKEKKSFEKTDDIVIRELLEIINKIQNFMLCNCSVDDLPYFNLDADIKKELYGYSIDTVDTTLKINEMISNTSFLDLKTDICSVDQMLLRSIVNPIDSADNAKTCISNSIRYARIVLTGEKDRTSINDIYSRIEQTYDIEIIYFYQKSVLNILILVLHNTLNTLFLKPRNELVMIVLNVQQKMEKHYWKYPKVLYGYIDYLSIAVDTWLTPDQILAHLKYDISDLFDSIKLLDFNDNCSFEEFTNAILESENDFECFNELFKVLQDEYNKQYTPFIVDSSVRKYVRPTRITGVDRRYKNKSDMCVYVNALYSYCVNLTDTLNKSIHDRSDNKNNQSMNIACDKFDFIKDFFFRIIGSDKADLDFLKIAYNSFMVMVNVKCKRDELYSDHVQRTMFLIMTELNDYGLKHCRSQSDSVGFLIHQNIDLEDLNELVEAKKTSADLINTTPTNLDGKIPHSDYSFYDLNDMYSRYVNMSNIFPKYKQFMTIYWKGETMSFNDICKYAGSSITLNYRFLYAFFDIYFTYIIAAFFFEIDYLNKMWELPFDIMSDDDLNSYSKSLESFSETFFPKTLHPLIGKIKSFARDIHQQNIKREFFAHKSKMIENEFADHHIIFDRSIDLKKNHDLDDWATCFSTFSQNISTIVKELNDKVKIVLGKYLLIHKFNENEQAWGYIFKV